MAEIKFEIVKNIGVISESAKGWTKGSLRGITTHPCTAINA